MSYEISHLQRRPCLYVGDPEVVEEIQESLKLSIQVKADPSPSLTANGYFFGRDVRVVRLDGTHLIPTPFNLEEKYEHASYQFKFDQLIPLMSHSVIDGNSDKGTGKGYLKEMVNEAIQVAKAMGIGYECAGIIEGGNCHITVNSKGESCALVGQLSVILTMMQLEKDNWFTPEKVEQRCKGVKEVADVDSYRIARNLQLLNVPLQEKIDKGFDMRDPVLPAEHERYREGAIRHEAMLSLTVEYMRILLKVERIGILPQTRYHIDLETADLGEGFIGVQSEELIVDFVRQQKKSEVYWRIAQNKAKKFYEARRQQMAVIKSLDLIPVPLPGIFENGTHMKANFLNGVRIGDVYLTNCDYESDDALQAFFRQELGKVMPKLKVHFLESTSEYPQRSESGLHCLSWIQA